MPYIDFIKKYKEKLAVDRNIEENILPAFRDFRDRINFFVCMDIYTPMITRIGLGVDRMFKLDDEDLKYLYNKYYPKIKEELEIEIDKVSKKYNVD